MRDLPSPTNNREIERDGATRESGSLHFRAPREPSPSLARPVGAGYACLADTSNEGASHESQHPTICTANVCVCVCLSLSVPMSASCFAQEQEKYARPGGEDYYGPRYEAREVPTQLKEVLDEDGRYTIPSFINLTIQRGEQDCWVTDQEPAPGTIVSCPQTVTVRLKHTCTGSDEHWARLPIELIDRTPPEVTCILDSSTDPQVSFGGVLRYLRPAAVLPVLVVDDSCDPSPDVQITLNGAPYALGTPITALGMQSIEVRLADDSHNTTSKGIRFEIRERVSYTGAAVVQNSTSEFSPDGRTGTIRATILLAAEQFDHRDILASSLRVLLRGPGGTVLHAQALPIRGGILEDCDVFQHESAQLLMNDCYVSVEVEGAFEPQIAHQLPAELVIIGVGASNGALTFDWGAVTVNSRPANPIATLLAAVNRQDDCEQPIPPPPPIPPGCQPVETIIEHPGLCNRPWAPGTGSCASGSGSAASLLASYTVNGSASSGAYAPFSGTCGTSTVCTGIIGEVVIVNQMVGDCCDCAFSISANGSVTVNAQAGGYNGPLLGSFTALANSAGGFAFWAPCGSLDMYLVPASASASQAGSSTPNPDVRTVPYSLACIDQACTTILIITTQGMVQTEATATHVYSSATAEARVNSTLTHAVNGTASPCVPCEP